MDADHDFFESLQRFKENTCQTKTLLKELKSSLKKSKLSKLGIAKKYIPKIYQSLPTEIDPVFNIGPRVKPAFDDIDVLKKHLFLLSDAAKYEQASFVTDRNIALFTYVVNDGLGDLRAAEQAYQILQKKFTNVVQIFLIHEKYKDSIKFKNEKNTILYFYSSERNSLSSLPEEINLALAKAEIVIQIPSFYPHWNELVEGLKLKKYLTVGEYGFIDSTWAHPKAKNTVCMGLHFLEKGILIKDADKLKQATISSKIRKKICGSKDFKSYFDQVSFSFAYLKNIEGAYVFLYLLATYLKESSKNIEIVCPEEGLFLELFKKNIIPWADLGIRDVCISFSGQSFLIPVSQSGKTLKIISLGPLSENDCIALMKRSKIITGCRGNQSFSEVVSLGSLFFFDAAEHAQPFIADLISVAKARIKNKMLAQYLSKFLEIKHFKGDWYQLSRIGCFMGENLKDEKFLKDFLFFMKIIKKEYRFNEGLINLIVKLINNGGLM